MDMRKILALVMILGIMLCAVNAASAEGYDTNITISGNEVGKSVLGLDVEVDNPIFKVLAGEISEGVQVEALVANRMPAVSNEDFLLEGSFRAGTQYYAFIRLEYQPETKPSAETIEAIKAAKFLFNGEEPLAMGVRTHDGAVELFYELPVNAPAPATGDGANIVLWTVLMAAGFAGMVLVLRRRRA